MKVSKIDHLPGIAGKFDCYMVESLPIRHERVPATDELGADEGTEWFFKVDRERATGTFDAYAWVWLRKASGEYELTEIGLSEVSRLDDTAAVFSENFLHLVTWARTEIEQRLADPKSYGLVA